MSASIKPAPAWTVASQAIRARLSDLNNLPRDWDSYGGSPPTPVALKRAESLVTDLAHDLGQELGQAAIPNDVFPNPDGGIELEWSVGEQLLGVEIGPDGDLRYLLKIGRGPDAKYTKGTIGASTAEIKGLLAALR